MIKKYIVSLVVIISLIAFSSIEDVPITKRVKISELVFIGTIDSMKYAPNSDDKYEFPFDTAYIKIQEILLDKSPMIDSTSTYVNLIMLKDGPLCFKNREYGIWILNTYDNYSNFQVRFPSDFQEIDKVNEIRKIISKLRNEEKNNTRK